MAEEGVIQATWTEAKLHPYLIGGAVAALVLVFWYMSRGTPSKTPQQFAFTYGPSDAQVRAGTALAIAQQADTTNLALAGINADVSKSNVSSYFDYLTHASDVSYAKEVNDNNLNAINAGFNYAAIVNNNQVALSNSANQLNYATTVNNNLLATQLGYKP